MLGSRSKLSIGQKVEILKLREKYLEYTDKQFCEMASEILGFHCALATVKRILQMKEKIMAQER